MLVVMAPSRLTMLGWEPRCDIIFSSDIRVFRTSLLVNGFNVLTATTVWSSWSFIPDGWWLIIKWKIIKKENSPTYSHGLQNSSECSSSDFFPHGESLLWELYAGVVRQKINLNMAMTVGGSGGRGHHSTWSCRKELLKSIDFGSPFIKRLSSAADSISLALCRLALVIMNKKLYS